MRCFVPDAVVDGRGVDGRGNCRGDDRGSDGRGCDVRPGRFGFTLIEVVVGLVLMATLVVGLVQATTAHKRNLRRASDRLVAVDVADDLLTRFTATGPSAASRGPWWPATGSVAGRPSWQWTTQPVAASDPLGVPVRVVRLTIVDRGGPQPVELVRVDIVEPRKPEERR